LLLLLKDCGEESIAEICRREGITTSLFYSWSKSLLEVVKRRLSGDTKRDATSNEVGVMREELVKYKELLAELTLSNHVLKRISNGLDVK
jgi:transposase